mgnify:CR=1 FL=1
MYIDENKEEEAIPDRTSARLVYPEGLLLNIFWQGILKIYQTFDEYVSISPKNRYLPYHFVPHVSISRKLNEQQTNQAFKILNHYFEPFYGKVIQVALVKTNPYQEIKIWNL